MSDTQNKDNVKRSAPDTQPEDSQVSKKQLTEALQQKDEQINRLESLVHQLADGKDQKNGSSTTQTSSNDTGKQSNQTEPAPLVSTGNNPTVPVPQTSNEIPSATTQSDIHKGAAETTEGRGSVTHPANKSAPHILETGHIYFFYRPKVMLEEAHTLDEVQRFYILLSPNTLKGQTEEKENGAEGHRLLMIPKKTLPEAERQEKFYAVVAQVTKDVNDLRTSLGAKKYDTKTQGQRDLEAARILGQGVYGIVSHQNKTHLAYVLEYPEDSSEAQQVFNIHKESTLHLSIKNPVTTQPSNLNSTELFDQGTGFSSTNKVKEYPSELQERFRSNRWCPADPPSFLDFVGAEMLFIGVNNDLVQELGEAGKQIEEAEKRDAEVESQPMNKEDREDTFKKLKEGRVQPILLGSQWNSDLDTQQKQ
ncbi:hypothetical protein PROFUN_10491 [Planoprotostelium fungivorum]|uniref:Uncharacterized protein n=2 Tax=Planoprotostelium fungivorum TaxID=1890364 RepID=A0A2P6NDG1_9EUKA|nr:hypothetical protein PROFUN_10491 [Planoprotostelium fungivorum]